jgi:hypothetical protein
MPDEVSEAASQSASAADAASEFFEKDIELTLRFFAG